MTAPSEYQMLNLSVFALVRLTAGGWCVSGHYGCEKGGGQTRTRLDLRSFPTQRTVMSTHSLAAPFPSRRACDRPSPVSHTRMALAGQELLSSGQATSVDRVDGLIERVTYFNEDSGFCVLRVKASGHRDVVTVVEYGLQLKATTLRTVASLSRYYTEVSVHGKPTLRDLAHVAPLLLSNAIEWEVIIAAARSYEIRSALYYPLRLLVFLVDNPVPPDALEELSPIRGSRMRDFGWQIGKLFYFVEPPPWQAKLGPT